MFNHKGHMAICARRVWLWLGYFEPVLTVSNPALIRPAQCGGQRGILDKGPSVVGGPYTAGRVAPRRVGIMKRRLILLSLLAALLVKIGRASCRERV